MPCVSPAFEYGNFLENGTSLCKTCSIQEGCHRQLQNGLQSKLAQLHLHLHRLGCLTSEDKLTDLGAIAKYFPQNGGLVVARKLAEGHQPGNFLSGMN